MLRELSDALASVADAIETREDCMAIVLFGAANRIVNECRCDPNNLPTQAPIPCGKDCIHCEDLPSVSSVSSVVNPPQTINLTLS